MGKDDINELFNKIINILMYAVMIGFSLLFAIDGYDSKGVVGAIIGWFRGVIFSLPFGMAIVALNLKCHIMLRLVISITVFVLYGNFIAREFNF